MWMFCCTWYIQYTCHSQLIDCWCLHSRQFWWQEKIQSIYPDQKMIQGWFEWKIHSWILAEDHDDFRLSIPWLTFQRLIRDDPCRRELSVLPPCLTCRETAREREKQRKRERMKDRMVDCSINHTESHLIQFFPSFYLSVSFWIDKDSVPPTKSVPDECLHYLFKKRKKSKWNWKEHLHRCDSSLPIAFITQSLWLCSRYIV